ncbi:MAG: flagellar biosynthesis protein FlhB [bacterium]
MKKLKYKYIREKSSEDYNLNNNNFYLKINLSYFDDEKTEDATDKKKEDTRKEGQVAMSKDVATAITIILSSLTLKAFSEFMYLQIGEMMTYCFSIIAEAENILDSSYFVGVIFYVLSKFALATAPLVIVCMIAGFVTNLIQVGWHPTTKPLEPSLKGLDPVGGLKKMFSLKPVVETLISIAKIIVITFVIYSVVKDEVYMIQNLIYINLAEVVVYVCNLCLDIALQVGYIFIIIALIDLKYQQYSHDKKIKMSKQDIKEEYKQADGDPMIKAKIRQKMMQAAQMRMMQDVPQADVVITNPTHYAVAIKYDRTKEGAPIVLAKGVDNLALRIKEKAKADGIEIVENKPLARALYASADVGKEIPPELYQSVAEVLAFVYKLKNLV